MLFAPASHKINPFLPTGIKGASAGLLIPSILPNINKEEAKSAPVLPAETEALILS